VTTIRRSGNPGRHSGRFWVSDLLVVAASLAVAISVKVGGVSRITLADRRHSGITDRVTVLVEDVPLGLVDRPPLLLVTDARLPAEVSGIPNGDVTHAVGVDDLGWTPVGRKVDLARRALTDTICAVGGKCAFAT